MCGFLLPARPQRAGQGCWLWQAGWDFAGPQDLLRCWGHQQIGSALGH